MKMKCLSNGQIGIFATAMSHLLRSGISAVDALALLREDEADPMLRGLWDQLLQNMDAGMPFDKALASSGRFPAYVCTLLAVGQCTGKNQEVLESLGKYYRDRARTEQQLRNGLLYPAVLLAVLLAVVTGLLVWVLPVFDDVYAQLGTGLTGISGGLLALGKGIKEALPWLAVLLAVLALVWTVPITRERLFRFLKRWLGVKGIYGKIQKARFVQTLWLCIGSGMTVQESVDMAAALGDTPAFRKCCQVCLEAAAGGASLSQTLRQGKLVRATHCRLLEAGERSGRSEQVLALLTQELLEAGEEALVRAVSRIEPMMVTVCSGLIGMILLSVLLPLLQIMTAIG